MDNQNFIFLKDKFENVYDVCCMVEKNYVDSKDNFMAPVAFSRIALEMILRTKLKIKSSDRRELSEIINIYCRKSHINQHKDSFYNDYIKYIKERGDEAIHTSFMDIKVANKVVERLQVLSHDIFNIKRDLPKYQLPTGNEGWLNEFDQNHPYFEEFKKSTLKIEEYEMKIQRLDESVINLNNKIPTKENIAEIVSQLQVDDVDDLKIVELQNKVEELHNLIPENLINDLAEIKELSEKIEKYNEIQNDLNYLDKVKDDYSFIKQDLDSIKDKYDEVENIKKQVSDLEKLDTNLEDLSIFKSKIEDLETAIQNNDYEDLKSRIDALNEFVIDFEKIEEVTEKVNDIRDNIAYITEKHLSPEQLEAVRSRANKLIIKAGPGAGKTRVLVERVQFLINEQHVDPKSVLVITFTEKAADELKYRLNADGDLSFEQIDQMQIGTIHGFCRTFLRNYVSSGIEVIDDEDNEKKVLFIKKHLKELGLDKYAFIPNYELKKVASKFDEYASFSVDMEQLLNFIGRQEFTSAHKPQNKRYRDFIDSMMPNEDSKFPLSEVRKKPFYKGRWFAHKRLAIARAYERYLKLLDERRSYDFNLLQIKTRDSLREMDRTKVVYKNILVDEFQDTDMIQFEIFEMLSKGSETVTYVGDINQSIYWWRGANSSNFDKLIKSGEFEVKELLTNYRSPKNIVNFNNHFMVDEMELRANNLDDGDLYYLNSRDKGEQAKKIVATIKYLKKENKVQKYSDIGLLFRSTRLYYIEELLNELKANDIKFNIQGAPDFEMYSEVECVLLLLWYLTEGMSYDNVFNLKEFANEELNEEMFNFEDSTLEVLRNYDGSPKIFSQYDADQLSDAGIVNEKDLIFFDKLNQLKKRFHSSFTDDANRLDVLGLYYEIFEITGYISEKFEEINQKGEDIDTNVELLNLGLISRKIKDFMDTVDRFDLDSLFEFLNSFYQEYSSPSNSLENSDRVQILTVHKSKGLEFPIVFICSLMEFSFPRRKPRKDKITDYPTPIDIKYAKIFEDKPIGSSFKDEYIKEFKNEEQRILYVGLTRAKSTLIVSHILNKVKDECKEFRNMKKYDPNFKELRPSLLPNLSSVKTNKPDEEEYEFSFTSLEDYNACPQKYNLIHNYNFVSPQNLGMRIGTIIHAVLDKINREIMDNPNHTIDIELIEKIIEEAIESNPDLKDNPLFLEMLNSVMGYYPLIGVEVSDNSSSESSGGGSGSGSDGWEDDFDFGEVVPARIIESEYPFTIPWFDARLRGSIDLIMEYGDAISLIDFKTSDEESIDEYIERYSKQLHFYLMAMESNSKYGPKKDITNLKVYSLKDNKFVDVDKEEHMEDILKSSLIDVSQKVKNKEYPQCEIELNKCEDCLLRNLCCR